MQVLHAAARRQVKAASVLPITTAQARDALIPNIWRVIEMYGRKLDVSLSGDFFDARRYDAHNGAGAAQAAIAHLRRENKILRALWGIRA